MESDFKCFYSGWWVGNKLFSTPMAFYYIGGETNLKDFRCLIKVLVIKSILKKKMTFGEVPSSNKSEKKLWNRLAVLTTYTRTQTQKEFGKH